MGALIYYIFVNYFKAQTIYDHFFDIQYTAGCRLTNRADLCGCFEIRMIHVQANRPPARTGSMKNLSLSDPVTLIQHHEIAVNLERTTIQILDLRV